MKKYILTAILTLAGWVSAADYAVTGITVPVSVQTLQNKAITTVTVESLSVLLTAESPLYIIRLSLKEADGTLVERKTVHMTHEQALALLPELNTIMTAAQAAISANMPALLQSAR